MSKILLIDIDSTIPNLALKKIEKYHIDRGDTVEWNNELGQLYADKVYVSCIFPENKHKCLAWEGKAEIGGTGYDLYKKLPKEIEDIKPRINWGFTTRGCIRRCYFCFVPEKEGNIHAIGDIYDIWDGKNKELMIMDNNILAMPNHFMKIAEQIRREKLRVDFNQGLDHRLVTPEIAKELLSIKHIKEIRFAFDDIKDVNTVLSCLDILRSAGLKDWKTRWYVYVSPFNSPKNVYDRMIIMKKQRQSVYIMRDRKIAKEKVFIGLASWGNTVGAFKTNCSLIELCDRSDRMKPYKKYLQALDNTQ